MKSIATLTMNPTIDVSYDVAEMRHTHKMRTDNEWYAPGGGGLNVARVFVRLGGHARSFYLSGGATGPALDGLIDLHQLVRTRIAITGPTRVASAVLERQSGKEYRFTPQGPRIAPEEWNECLDRLDETNADIAVLSGSLPPGVPDDFYAQATRRLRGKGIKVVLDSSGPALSHGIAQGDLLLVKPSSGELERYLGTSLRGHPAIAEAARGIVAEGKARLVAVTLGHEGAILARANGAWFLPALPIEAASAVGAGDSFVAAMVYALARGDDDFAAFGMGLAAGTAAVLRAGTGLAQAPDIARLLRQVPDPEPL
ncbi:1-phosphofructokinase family hexose kinase [Novosphingobium sp. BW1]|uniref:1-phosphofructokinase family hexose kinase n=1 Tax=Novosphingobium sp. BW1 TaxID=2592621 RepID=UPI0011DE7FE8|nr:1-phosphofructokinase family hexose kinase [Novosphingobium sp. BW1]TYC93999.1 1-phosphofructokinase family hexose kinase [Novosphingobium sp. BW1]